MIDYLSIALTHGLLVLACWRLLTRADLERDPSPAEEGAGDAEPAKKVRWRVRRA